MTMNTQGFVAVTGAISTLLIGVASAIWAMEQRYATQEDLGKLERDTVTTLIEFQCNMVLRSLNELRAKERVSELSPYDAIRLDQLESARWRDCRQGYGLGDRGILEQEPRDP